MNTMDNSQQNAEAEIKSSPKDLFLHLLISITLYASAVSFIALIFGYINSLFPGFPGFYSDGVSNQVRLASSVLIVVFPVFILLSWFAGREFRSLPAKREIKLRKWLIYFTLFASAVTIIVDLVVLVHRFYGGDLPARFFWKVLVILAVAIIIFGYNFWDLKRRNFSSREPKIIALIAGILVLGALVVGFFTIGSPTEQRKQQFDEIRIIDLQAIQSRIDDFWRTKNRLPKDLVELQKNEPNFPLPLDPQTSQPYEYEPTPPKSFKLCAVFDASEQFFEKRYAPIVPLWPHGQGRTCFDRSVSDFSTREIKPY